MKRDGSIRTAVRKIAAVAVGVAGIVGVLAAPAVASVVPSPPPNGTEPSLVRPAITTPANGWTAATTPAGADQLFGVACPTPTVCTAVGAAFPTSTTTTGAALYSTDGGLNWSPAQSLPGGLPGLFNVSCPSASFCMAAASSQQASPGNAAIVSTDGGKTWASVAAPPGNTTGADSLFCVSAADCWVGTGGAVDATTDGGASWSQTILLPGASFGPGPVAGLWFANASTGWAISYSQCGGPSVHNCGGWVLTTSDGGRTWTVVLAAGINSSLGSPVGLSCTSATACLVLGQDSSGARLSATANGGSTWTNPPLPSGLDTQMTGVESENVLTCDGATDCYITGWNGGTGGSGVPYTNATSEVFATTDGGTTWSPTPTTPAVAAGFAITCVPGLPSDCVDVGLGSALTASNGVQGAAQVTTDGGSLPFITAVTPSSGPLTGGQTVTISGADLGSPAAVTFGGVPATGITSVSSTELTATVPAGVAPGVVNVQVTGALGVSPAYDSNAPSDLGPDGYLYVNPGAYNALTPYRICDTRSGNSTPCSGETIGQGGGFCLGIAGSEPSGQTTGGVPASGAEAVVLNVTVIDSNVPVAHGGSPGYLTVAPGGVATPLASNLNYVGGARPNLVEVALGFSGTVCMSNAATGEAVDVVVDVEGWVATSSTGAGYSPVAPTRICDTRPNNPSGLSGVAAQCAGQTFHAQSTLSIHVAGAGPVPSGAVAAVLNVTVTNTTTGGYLTVWPQGLTQPLASNLNWTAGATVANRVVVPLSSNGEVTIFNSAGSADVIVDVGGYFASSGGLMFTPSSPTRICDTRAGNATECAGQTLGASKTLQVAAGGIDGIPANAAALVANVTVADTSTGGYLTVWPQGAAQPTSSDVNWAPGQVVPNLVVVKLGGTGGLSIFNSHGSTDVIVDVAGWYS